MGRFIYDSAGTSVDVEGSHARAPAPRDHEQTPPIGVLHARYRRGRRQRAPQLLDEPRRADPVPLLRQPTTPPINREWVEELMLVASGPHGLSVIPEPAEHAVTAK